MTAFHDMPIGTRTSWLDWANDHDWGAGPARLATNLETGRIGMHVEGAVKDECGDWGVETFLAMTPAELRGWAGY